MADAHTETNKKQDNKKYIVAAVAIVVVIGILAVAVNGQSTPTAATGDSISVYYTGTYANGSVFDSNVGNQKPLLNFTVGSGQVITGFDNAVVGMRIGQTKNVTIPANEAYGEVNPALIISVSLRQFRNQTVRPGMQVNEISNGQQYIGIITAVNSTNATINFNPPLAGKTLNFKIQVVAIHKAASHS